MITPFDDVIADIKKRGFHNHRLEDRSDIVFPQLDVWAVDEGHLNFDLPPDVFEKPGKLFVWFLRGNRLLWEEQVDWPGSGTIVKGR